MKKPDTSKTGVKLIGFALALALCIGLGFVTGVFKSMGQVFSDIQIDFRVVLKLLVMAVMVIVVENLILFILSLIKFQKQKAQSIASIAASALRYVALIVIICWGLSILGVDVSTIAAGVGVIALIIGFAANSVIADLVTGIFILFENHYNVGDFVEVDGFRGKVVSIGIRTTRLEDAGGNVKIMNNSNMSNILNRSDHTSRAVASIGIPYGTDLRELEEKLPGILSRIYEDNREILLDVPIYLGVDELAASSVNLKFVVEVEDLNIFAAGRVLNRGLLLGFKDAGVEVPFPQVDVHHK